MNEFFGDQEARPVWVDPSTGSECVTTTASNVEATGYLQVDVPCTRCAELQCDAEIGRNVRMMIMGRGGFCAIKRTQSPHCAEVDTFEVMDDNGRVVGRSRGMRGQSEAIAEALRETEDR